IRHEGDQINDANYAVGTLLPLGAKATVQGAGRDSITFVADGTKLTLSHSYGTKEETFQQYIDKVLVANDPKLQVASFQPAVQEAIRDARVERGMTREQVILSLGYPPTHRTPSTNDREWTYWYNRWVTYRVVFNDAGVVTDIVGRPAPTRDQPIVVGAPKPVPASRSTKKKKGH